MIYQHGGTPYVVSLEPLPDGTFRACIGDRELVVTAQRLAGGWLLTLDGSQVTVYTASRGSERFVALDGAAFTLTIPESRRRSVVSGSGDLTAQMPGQVREILVQLGAQVERGQTLLLLEAMKMEIRVAAPAAGRVERVLVEVGQVVDRGQRLVELVESE